MRNIILFLLLMLVNFQLVDAQTPNWVNSSQRKFNYPESQYLIGFASNINSSNEQINEMLANLSDLAKKDLIESIYVSIQSSSTLQIEETDDNISEYYKQSSESLSKADIAGLKIETYYDKRNNTGYAFAFALKSEVISFYKNIISLKLSTISNKINEAKLYLLTNNNQNALKTYAQTLAYFREIENAKFLLFALGKTENEYHQTDEANRLYLQIKEEINKIYESEQIILRAKKDEIEVKFGQPIPEPIEIVAISKNRNGVEKVLPNVPVLFIDKDVQYCNATTDYSGSAKCFINKVSSTEKIQVVSAMIDLSSYLGIDSIDAKNEILKSFSASTDIKLIASGLTFWISSKEYDLSSNKLSIPFIEPKIKEALSTINYTFVNDPKIADYKIELIAKIRKGNNIYNLYFTYLDATVSVFDFTTKKEIYKNSFVNIKGGGNSYESASVKSYNKAAETISSEITKF